MPTFKVEWTAQGELELEADDDEEARQLMADGIRNLDHSMFDSIEVDEVTADSVEEI